MQRCYLTFQFGLGVRHRTDSNSSGDCKLQLLKLAIVKDIEFE